eukprot:12421351-Karenia_brevis.AAC.1
MDGGTDFEERCGTTWWCASTRTHLQARVPAGVTTSADSWTEEVDSHMVQTGASENMTVEMHSRLYATECTISVNLHSGLWWISCVLAGSLYMFLFTLLQLPYALMASTWAATSPFVLQVVASGVARGVVSAIAYHTADVLMSE